MWQESTPPEPPCMFLATPYLRLAILKAGVKFIPIQGTFPIQRLTKSCGRPKER